MTFPTESFDVYKLKRHHQDTAGDHEPVDLQGNLPAVSLEITRGRVRQRVRTVSVPVFLIGSAPDCDLVIGTPQFPEVHTYLYVTPKGVSVRHLGVNPPLLVNGRVVETAIIHNQDRLQLGPGIDLVLHIGSPAELTNERLLRFDRPVTLIRPRTTSAPSIIQS